MSLFTPRQDGNLNQIQKDLKAAIDQLETRVRALDQAGVQVVAGPFTMSSENVLEYVGAGGDTITIPSASNITGRRSRARVVMNNGTGAITLAAAGTDTVNGGASIGLAAGSSVVLEPNGDAKTQAIGLGDGAGFQSVMHAAANSGLSSWRLAGSVTVQSASGVAITANQLRAVPFIAPRAPATLTDLGFEVTIGLAGNARCGLYSNLGDNNLYPGTLLVDGGSLSTAAAGTKNTSGLAIALTPGAVYWLVHVQSAAAATRVVPSPSDVLGHANDATGRIWVDIIAAFAFAALPATFPAGGTQCDNTGGTTNSVPALYFKVN